MTPDSEAEKAAREYADNRYRPACSPNIDGRWRTHKDDFLAGFLSGQVYERERIIAWWREKTKDEFWTARDLLQEFLKEQAE